MGAEGSEDVDRDSTSMEDGYVEGACHVCLPVLLRGMAIKDCPDVLKYVRVAGPEMQSIARSDVQVWELASRTDNAVVIAEETAGCSVHAVGARPKYALGRLAQRLVKSHDFDELENTNQQEWCLRRTLSSGPQRLRAELEGFPSDQYGNGDVCVAYFSRDDGQRR